MRHLAAAILLALGGKPVDEAGIKAVLAAGGVKGDDAKIKKVVEALKGKDVLKEAKEGIGKVSVSAPAKEEKKETKAPPKKEEKKQEPEPEEEGGFGDLFG